MKIKLILINLKSALFFIVLLSFFNVRAQTTPSSFAALSVWLTPDSITLGGGNEVLDWKDISGNLNNAIQGVGLNQPLFSDSILQLNNQGVVRFDGSEDFLEILDNASIDFDTTFTIIVLAKQNILASDESLLSKWDYSTQGSWAFQTDGVADELRVFVANALSDAGGNNIVTTNADLDTSYFYYQ